MMEISPKKSKRRWVPGPWRTFVLSIIIASIIIFLSVTWVSFVTIINQRNDAQDLAQSRQEKIVALNLGISNLEYLLDAQKQEELQGKGLERIRQLQSRIDPQMSTWIYNSIKVFSKKYGVDESLVIHVINRESGFDVFAKSNKGARGLMQVMWSAHEKMLKAMGIKNVHQLFHIDKNIEAGCKILRMYLDKNKTTYGALKAYVGGEHDKYIRDIFSTMIDYQIKFSSEKPQQKIEREGKK